MTRYFIQAAIILVLFCMTPFTGKASAEHLTSGIEVTGDDMKISTADHAGKSSPLQPAKQDLPHLPKAKPPHMEELPHIHRFHKERMKQLSQHHSKWWLLSQVIIVLCHISILMIAWQHVTH